MKRPSLNHVYRLVWNDRLNAWVAVAENVKARGKRASGALTLAVLAALGLAPSAYALDDAALPTNGQIIAGQGSINQQGNTLTLNQSSNRLIAQWDTFNIGKNSSVAFNQASSSSVALNRILDSNPSEIFGSLSANGQVYLVNPSGIVFGKGSQVNVGGLVASSLNISNEDFLAGNLKFSGSNDSGAVINQGSISAAHGGVVALLAPQVTNDGAIKADGGSALLAAGSGVSLDFVGDGLISYNIDAGTTRSLVQNGGLVQADGGLAVLTAKAADAVNQAVVNNTGTVRAQTLAQREGRILLLSDMSNGLTTNNGTLDASAPVSGNGGFIETSASDVKIADGSVIDTRAANGATGEWLLDPNDIRVQATGGTTSGAQLANDLLTTNVILDTVTRGVPGNGDIFIDDVVTAAGSSMTGSGGGRYLTLRAERDVNINNAISGVNSLSVRVEATRDVNFGAGGSVTTRGGNFTIGNAPGAIGNYATTHGGNVTMAEGSYVNVGSGSLDIDVTGTIKLATNSLRVTGSNTRYLDTGIRSYSNSYSNYLRLKAGTAITTSNIADNSVEDITGMTDVILESATIGDVFSPIKIRRTSLGNTLTLNNSTGSSYVNVLNANTQHGFNDISINIGTQANAEQNLSLGGNLDGHGHILMSTNGDGVLVLQDDDIDTAGTRSNLSITTTGTGNGINFANNSVDVGDRSFRATAHTMAGDGTDGIAEINAGTLSFNGTEVGNAADRLEISGGDQPGGSNSLSINNTGGSTYVTSVDDSFTNIDMTNVKAVGTHSVWFDTDHIDYGTNGTSIALPTITGTSGAGNGADVHARNRNISVTANSGNISFDTGSVNTGSGSLSATISAGNSDGDGTHGAAIHAASGKDLHAEITAGDVSFTVGPTGTGAISNIEIAKGAGASNNTLSVYTHQGDVDLTELDSHHFKTLDVTLKDTHHAGQTVDIDLNGDDDVSLTDTSGLLTLDATHLALSDFNRNWYLNATERNVQIDGVARGSGTYSIYGSGLNLNNDVLTDGGSITLHSEIRNIQMMKSVRIDSNADDDANSTSTGSAGSISVTGNISGDSDGYTLAMDTSSTTQGGGSLDFDGDLGNNHSGYLSGAAFTTKGSANTNDGYLTLNGTSFLLDGDFSAIGKTQFTKSNADVTIDTQQDNAGDAGNITFGGQSLSTSSSTGYSFNSNTIASAANGGNVALTTFENGTLYAKSFTINTASGFGTSGNIELPGINTASSGYNGTTTNQSYTGNIITLHGDLSTDGGNVRLEGDTRLAESVTIRTSGSMSRAGDVTVVGSAISAMTAGTDLTINTSSNSFGAGEVKLSAGNAGGAFLDDLSIDARALASGSGNSISLQSVVETTGNQTYAGGVVSALALTSPGTISIDIASDQTTAVASRITADAVALRGGTFSFNNAGNQVSTLAAQSGSVTFVNSGALTIGSVAGIDGIDSSGSVQVTTVSGDLTLANSVSTTSTAFNAIVLLADLNASFGSSAGGNILVNNGASVTTGAGGRAILYTGSVDNSTGVTDVVGYGSGNFRYGSDEGHSEYTKALVAGAVYAVYRERPTISVDVDDATAVYGSSPELTATFVNGKNGDAGANFTYTVDGATSSAGKHVVGTHTVTATASAGAEELGYDVTGTTTGTLTITPKELTVSGITADRTYDGTTDATLETSGAIVSGLVGSDDVDQDYNGASGAFGDKNVGTGKTVTVNGIALTGEDAANYTVTGSATGDISARVLNVDFTGNNRVYDGSTDASVYTTDDRVDYDALTINRTANFADKNVGTNKQIDISDITLSGADAGNYQLASTSGTATADVTVRTLNVDFTGDNRVYDGTTAATVTANDDRVAGDDLVIDRTAAFGDRNAGIGKIVSISNVSLSGDDANNYALATPNDSTTADIAARTLNIDFTGSNRVYDGTTATTVDTSDDRIVGDDLVIDRTAAFGDKNVGTGKIVNVSNVTLSGADANNYVVASANDTTTADIAARTLNVGFTGDNRVYDGTTAATVTANDDRVTGDDLIIDRTAAFGDKNVGTGKTVSISDVSLSGADAGNYSLVASNDTTTADIAARTLNIDFASENRVYDGTTHIIVTSNDDRVAGDDLVIDQSAALADKNAGIGKLVNVSNITMGGADAGNYQIASSSGTSTADIAARVLTLGYTGDGKTFDGTPRAGVSVTDDRVEGDNLSYDVNAHFTDFTVGDNREVLIDGVTLGGADAGNYSIANPTGSSTANIKAGPISSAILTSITSPQSTLNGTSTTPQIATKEIVVGAGAGSNSLIQNASSIITDDRVITFQGGLTLNVGAGSQNVIMSSFPTMSTLTFNSLPSKTEEHNSGVPVFEVRNSAAQQTGAVDIVDGGKTLSVSSSASGGAANIDIKNIVGPSASGTIHLPGGQEIKLTTTIDPNQVLSISVPKNAPSVDVNDITLVGIALSAQQLAVEPKRIKAVVIQTER